ncbi:hypothetical protein OG417_44860 [Actinoallomurus sp. NBC_01490]|uniref:hypothetical protein n=1 Tax=Actinoallomurus sp. NBC_01490 TaxID=2903557 RepID=UPI002E2FF81F|nr:hypothetical protein [Actinoallomurus sp. NBC_01490]
MIRVSDPDGKIFEEIEAENAELGPGMAVLPRQRAAKSPGTILDYRLRTDRDGVEHVVTYTVQWGNGEIEVVAMTEVKPYPVESTEMVAVEPGWNNAFEDDPAYWERVEAHQRKLDQRRGGR